MKTYLEADVPEELCQHLFTSFKRKICQASPETQRQSPGVSQLNTLGEPALPLLGTSWHGGMLGSPPRHPMGMKVAGWHLQWVASGPAHSPTDGFLGTLCSSAEERAFPRGGDPWGIIALIPPFPPCVQSPSHSMPASPSRQRWPMALPQVLVWAATERTGGCTQSRGLVPGTQLLPPLAPAWADLQHVETSAERSINCKRTGRTLPGCSAATSGLGNSSGWWCGTTSSLPGPKHSGSWHPGSHGARQEVEGPPVVPLGEPWGWDASLLWG